MLLCGRRRQIRIGKIAALALLPLALSSCGGAAKPSEPLLPTTGQVFYQGKPAIGATVILHPLVEPEKWKQGFPSGPVTADGSVKIKTAGEWDGAPAGEYMVVVVWMPAASGDERTAEEGTVDKLAGKYADPANSAWKVTVAGTRCELPRMDLQ